MSKEPSHLKRIVLFGLLLFALLSLLVLVVITLGWRPAGSFRDHIAQLQAQGEPTTIAELQPDLADDVDAQDNAASYWQRCEEGVNQLQDHVVELSMIEDPGWKEHPSPEQLEKIRDMFASQPDLLPCIVEATECPVYRPLHDYSLEPTQFTEGMLDGLGAPRAWLRLIDLRVTQAIAEGDANEAFAWVMRAFQIGEWVEQEPLMVSYLVAMACKSMAARAATRVVQSDLELTDEQHDALDQLLLAQDEMPGYVNALRSERAFSIQSMSQSAMFVLRYRVGAATLRAYEQAILAGPVLECEANNGPPVISPDDPLSQLMPSLDAFRHAVNRTRSGLRRLRAMNLLKKNGNDPKHWDDQHIQDLGGPERQWLDPESTTIQLIRPAEPDTD